jgi:hypothetical protein
MPQKEYTHLNDLAVRFRLSLVEKLRTSNARRQTRPLQTTKEHDREMLRVTTKRIARGLHLCHMIFRSKYIHMRPAIFNRRNSQRCCRANLRTVKPASVRLVTRPRS